MLSMREGGGRIQSVVFAPKADAVLTADPRGAISQWKVNNPHPEITLQTVFGKVWYEGYPEPAYVWQSTGGTDDFEAKFSLTPLIYGTLKGTFYALLIAIPVALLAAVYVSEFMHPNLKAYIKPVVEIMAALPSVVLGFLAGLWLAPMVEKVVPGLFLMPLVQAVFILGALLLWRLFPAGMRSRLRTGSEVLLLLPVVVLGMWVSFQLGGMVSPTARPKPIMMAEKIPGLAVGRTMRTAVCQRLAPRARDPARRCWGTLDSESSAIVKMIGITAKPIAIPTTREFR